MTKQSVTLDLPEVINLPEALTHYGNLKPLFDFAIWMDIPGEFGKKTRWQLDVHYSAGDYSLECPMCGSACQRLYAVAPGILICEHCRTGEYPNE
jgi:hypothetical protein